MSQALLKLELSARAYHRVLEGARTVTDLSGSEEPGFHPAYKRPAQVDRIGKQIGRIYGRGKPALYIYPELPEQNRTCY